MTCKDCLYKPRCTYRDNKEFKSEERLCFSDRSEWVHLPDDEYTFTIRGDIAKHLIIANCRAADKEKEERGK